METGRAEAQAGPWSLILRDVPGIWAVPLPPLGSVQGWNPELAECPPYHMDFCHLREEVAKDQEMDH